MYICMYVSVDFYFLGREITQKKYSVRSTDRGQK